MIFIKKIVPFKKELFFKDNIAEITSISLEQDYKFTNLGVSGSFFINGEYKVTNVSSEVDKFDFTVPFDINFNEKYDLSHATFVVEDFYYEIFDSNVLLVNIEVKVDNLDESREIIDFEEEEEEIIFKEDKTIYKDYFEPSSDYVTYKIYIVKENDKLEKIMENYKVDREELKKYNDLDNIKLGDKIIIPYYD